MHGLHALTYHSVSSFKGIGKRKPLKLRLKTPTYCDTLRGLGDDWKVEDDLDGCEKFICAAANVPISEVPKPWEGHPWLAQKWYTALV